MSPRRPTTRERIADWNLAYTVIFEELVPMVFLRDAPADLAINASMAARRTAALAAAILVASAGVDRTVAAAVTEDADG